MQVIKRVHQDILGAVWCLKLKPTGLVLGDVELTKRQYLHPNTVASTHITAITTATNSKATTINSTATTSGITTTYYHCYYYYLLLRLLKLSILRRRMWGY